MNTNTNTNTITDTTELMRGMSDHTMQTPQKRISASPSPQNSSGSVGKRLKRPPKKFFGDTTDMIILQDMRLSQPNDASHLNKLHCFVRAELLEVFVLKPGAMVNEHSNNSEKNVVGIRCSQCGPLSKKERGNEKMAVFFPKSIQDLYRGVCTWQRIHFFSCEHMSDYYKQQYKHFKQSDPTRGRKAHWISSAYETGLRNIDAERSGIFYDPDSAIDKKHDHTLNSKTGSPGTPGTPASLTGTPIATTSNSTGKKKKKSKTPSKKKTGNNKNLEGTTFAGSNDVQNYGGTTSTTGAAVAGGQQHYPNPHQYPYQYHPQQQQQQQQQQHQYQQQHQQQQYQQQHQQQQYQQYQPQQYMAEEERLGIGMEEPGLGVSPPLDPEFGVAPEEVNDFEFFGIEFDDNVANSPTKVTATAATAATRTDTAEIARITDSVEIAATTDTVEITKI